MSEVRYKRRVVCDPDDEIVISGISGRFPNTANVADFAYNLYNKVDMVDDAETRWKHIDNEIPKRLGKTVNLEKFDASFFSVHQRQANYIDPQCRMLLEHAYEAVLDAGINPKSLRGSRTSVMIGACFVESESHLFYEQSVKDGLGLTGACRAMLANRISFSMDLKGPSFLVDTACSSGCYALDSAFESIRNGECDAAIIGASNLLLHPNLTLQFARLGVLSKTGWCRPLDKDANGYTRAEAITCIFLQKKKDAKRVYANLVYSKTNNDGFKKEAITYPSGPSQIRLLDEFYRDLRMDPTLVDYVEGHSTGTYVGDPEECHTLDTIYCKNRQKPLLIGAVKSNMGHPEPASSLCSIIKCLLAFENKKLPPNINFTGPRSDCTALVEGRLKVIDEVTDFDGNYIAINSFGFGGGNGHALLKAVSRDKVNYGIPNDSLPRLVTWSGRTEEAIETIMNGIASKPLDAEFVALLQNTQTDTISGNTYRGYGIFKQEGDGNAICLNKSVDHFSSSRRPLVWVFSGMGSQFSTMGKDLMNIPIFANAIEKCHNVLSPFGLNLKEIVTSSDPTTFDNILHSFVGISAVQIGLTDILKAIGIVPDYIIGHSFGELACAYADGCHTAEEMILASYSRGMASVETKTIFGSMAAVGLGYSKLKDMLPEDVFIACHNSNDSCTISGPAESVATFVAKLKSENYFAKEVACSNIPYHSQYIAQMGPNLLRRLNEVIINPKKRSSKWISSSVPESKWSLIESQYSSAQYHTENLLNPVLFEEACVHLPKDALTIEIAPFGLLQAILKRSFPEGLHTSLAQRNNPQNSLFLLNSLGGLFKNGVDFDISKIYPAIQWPVSRGTPMISPLIKWDHKENYFVMKYDERIMVDYPFTINIQDPEYEYVTGHEIDRRILFPATGYLYLTWQSFAIQNRLKLEDCDVEFEEVKFVRATTLSKNQIAKLTVLIQRGNGRFDILDGATTVVTGIVRFPKDNKMVSLDVQDDEKTVVLKTRDFYKELRLRGYHYKGLFRSVVSARSDGLRGEVQWHNNWVAFLDNLLQLQIVATDTRSLVLPTGLRKLVINPKEVLEAVKEEKIVQVYSSKHINTLRCSGIEMRDLVANSVGRRAPPGAPVLESYEFIPHLPTPAMSKTNMARFCVQLALENYPVSKISSFEIDANDGKEPISEFIGNAVGDLPLVTADLTYITQRTLEIPENIKIVSTDISSCADNSTFIIRSNCLQDTQFLESITSLISENGFVISRESSSNQQTQLKSLPNGYQVIAVIPLENEDEIIALILYNKPQPPISYKTVKISNNDEELTWLTTLQDAVKEGQVIAYSERESLCGIIGLVNCIRKEPNGGNLKCIFTDDPRAPLFNLENPFYEKVLTQGLAINVYRNGKWGSYRHLLLNTIIPPTPQSSQCIANVTQRGDLSSFIWHEGIMPYIKTSKIVANIHYASLNFRDAMLATGKLAVETCGNTRLDQQCILGFEFSGITEDGRRIMGVNLGGAMASKTEIDEAFTWDVPDNWTLEEASTIACVYMTVYFSFFVATKIEKGKSILIHAGTGGVGLAAIRTALAYGLEVFTTCSTEEKKNFLLTEYPQLKADHIGNSRDTSFEDMVKERTNGRGVDYVLNSLSEDKLKASIKCLAVGGVFLEIGKYDMANDNKIGLGDFLRELCFQAVLVDQLIKSTRDTKHELRRLMQRDLDRGIIKPFKANVFPPHEIEQAFRFLASGKHMGKVVIKMRENENDAFTLPISVLPRVYCYPERSYIIPGGLGGFGLELADWLVLRNCKKLILSSSRGVSKPYQLYRIRLWESYGVKVVVNTSDISTREGCAELINEANKLGPVGGIFNLAVALRDSIFENQDVTKFKESLAPKAIATKHLDELSRSLCPNLHYFVIFSSVSCGRGNAGQSNYGMSNSVMERIIEQRHSLGLPAKAIQWGAVGEVGLVADMQEDKLDLEIGGTLQQRISSCLEELDPLITSKHPIVASMVVAEKRFSSATSGNIVETILNVMGIKDIKSVSFETTLAEMGMDSLMTVEIQQLLEREFDLTLPTQEIRAMTLSQLQKIVKSKSSGDGEVKSKISSNVPKGIALLMRNLGDETNASQTILKLESQSNEGTKLLIIPGLEGMAGKAWFDIAKKLNYPTYILQTQSTWQAKNLGEIYEIIIGEVLNLYKDDANFLVVAYSFGSLIGMKIVSALEKAQKSGKIILVDGAPKFLHKLAIEHFPKNFREEDIQSIVIVNTIFTLFPDDDGKVVKAVLLENSWENRLKKLTELYRDQKIYSVDYGVKLLNSLVNRLILVANLNLKEFPTLNQTQTMLIRTSEHSLNDIEQDYGLSEFVASGVDVKFLEGNHATVLDNIKLSETINLLQI